MKKASTLTLALIIGFVICINLFVGLCFSENRRTAKEYREEYREQGRIQVRQQAIDVGSAKVIDGNFIWRTNDVTLVELKEALLEELKEALLKEIRRRDGSEEEKDEKEAGKESGKEVGEEKSPAEEGKGQEEGSKEAQEECRKGSEEERQATGIHEQDAQSIH